MHGQKNVKLCNTKFDCKEIKHFPPHETETTEPRKVGTVQYICTVNTFVYLSSSSSLYNHAQPKRGTEKDKAVEPRRDKRGKAGKRAN
jgi:hypothetical protein